MFRKMILALTAAAALGTAALAPTSASAFPFKGGWHGHGHFGHFGRWGGWYGGWGGYDEGCYLIRGRVIICE